MAEKRRYKRYGRARKKRENWFTRLPLWSKIMIGIVLILILTVAVAYWYVNSKLENMDRTEIKAEDLVINNEVRESLNLGDGYTNIALFGVDSREKNLGAGTLSDCIIVASLNNQTKEIRMVSVYRDTLLNLSNGTYTKCNAAYSYGGPVMAINMLNMNLDLDIEDYVTVDFSAISDGIDMLGGIDIEITEEELKALNYHLVGTAIAVGRESPFVESAGMVHMNGLQATTYARIRSTAGGDFTRTKRQRLVIEKVVEKVKQTDLKTLDAMINTMFPKISTSFTLTEMLTYATGYKDYVLGENTGFPYNDLMSTDTLSGYGSIVIAGSLTSNVSRVHQFLFGTENYTPSAQVQTISSEITSRVEAARGGGSNQSTPPQTNPGTQEPQQPDSGTQEPQQPDLGTQEPQQPDPGTQEPQQPDPGTQEPQQPEGGESQTQPSTDGETNPAAETGGGE